MSVILVFMNIINFVSLIVWMSAAFASFVPSFSKDLLSSNDYKWVPENGIGFDENGALKLSNMEPEKFKELAPEGYEIKPTGSDSYGDLWTCRVVRNISINGDTKEVIDYGFVGGSGYLEERGKNPFYCKVTLNTHEPSGGEPVELELNTQNFVKHVKLKKNENQETLVSEILGSITRVQVLAIKQEEDYCWKSIGKRKYNQRIRLLGFKPDQHLDEALSWFLVPFVMPRTPTFSPTEVYYHHRGESDNQGAVNYICRIQSPGGYARPGQGYGELVEMANGNTALKIKRSRRCESGRFYQGVSIGIRPTVQVLVKRGKESC